MPSSFVTRFAPSPTGHLHLGHAYAALIAFNAAQAAGGRFFLRIEDIDAGRCKPEFETAILDTLSWLGLTWERPVRRQSEHFADYAGALDRLRDASLVYRCFKTRREILERIASAPHAPPITPDQNHNGDPGELQANAGTPFVSAPLPAAAETELLNAGKPFAWRLSMSAAVAWLADQGSPPLTFRTHFIDEASDETSDITSDGSRERTWTATPEIFGDPVLARKDSGVSYHIASVVDDALQGITHVIRGEDLASAAHLHCLLQALLGLPTPVYRHHRLITDAAGKRLAKRDRAATIVSLRENGATPATIRRQLNL